MQWLRKFSGALAGFWGLLLVACTSQAVTPLRNDLQASVLAGPVHQSIMRKYDFVQPSPQLTAMLRDPENIAEDSVLAGAVAEDLRQITYTGEFDRDGWLQSADMAWSDAPGYVLRMDRQRVGPGRFSITASLIAPPEHGAVVFDMGSGLVSHRAAGVVEIEMPGRSRNVDVRDDAGRLLHSETWALESGVVPAHTRTEYSSYDAAGRGLAGIDIRDELKRYFTVRYFGADSYGNPLRKLIVYSDSPRFESAPVAAELWINDSRYYDETR